MTRHSRIVTLGLAAAIAATGLVALAGDLNPPAGPVASTHKTLTEVEPRIAINATNTPGDGDSLFKITMPGSYYLAGNITGESGKHGVEIAANGVTLDLNGFDLAGIPAMGAFDGVSATVSSLRNIAVVNGSIRNWGGEGIDLSTFTAVNCRVADVLASGNAANGIQIGITSSVTHCSAYGNSGHGISTEFGARVSNCTAASNSNSGISVSSESTVANCTAEGNSVNGIRCVSNNLIRDNTCPFNGAGFGAGIRATSNENRIEGNYCTRADIGIEVNANRNLIIKNTCVNNTTDWVLAADNVVGPILDRRFPGGPAINGFSASDTTGSSHPNANFSY